MQRREKTAQELVKEDDKLCQQAEKKSVEFAQIKANALHAKSQEQRKKIENEDKQIEYLNKKLKKNVRKHMISFCCFCQL